MNLCFAFIAIAGTIAWRLVLITEAKLRLDVTEFCRTLLTGHIFVFASALPLVWLDHWTLNLHALLMLAAFLTAIPFIAKKKISFFLAGSSIQLLSILVALTVGIGLQWHGIYYLYATHDPSAYLNSAHHIARTGSFFHSDPLKRIAFGEGNEKLKPLLNADRAPEDWQLTRNYGVIPFDLPKGLSSYHGFFGAPLFLAIGMKLFGEEHGLRIQWLYFVTVAISMVALCELLIGPSSLFSSLVVWIFALCPLVAPLYREPLSEPLAAVFFMGIIVALFDMERRPTFARFLLVGSVLGSVCTRVSALMYLPFLVLTCLWLEKQTKEKALNRGLWVGMIASCLGGILFIFHLSPTYTQEILAFYSHSLLKFFPAATGDFFTSTKSLVPVIGTVGLLLFVGRRRLLNIVEAVYARRNWHLLWKFFFAVLTAGVLVRYLRLITKLTDNFGDYPFVLFNLDSLLFYGGPLVVALGLLFWFSHLIQTRKPSFIFLQSFLPFCVFFYSVFRFMPLNLQVNFQRYLLIELVPLTIVGMIVFLASLRRTRNHYWVIPVLTFTFFWNGGITFAINHSDICRTAFATYSNLRQSLSQLSAEGKRPVVVAVGTSWLEQSFLMPLSNGFDIPLVFVNHPFSEEASLGISELERLGYSPILAVGRSSENPFSLPVHESGRSWGPWKEIDDCRYYPKFGFGAPPLELAESCVHLSLLQAIPVQTNQSASWWEPAWQFRNATLPLLVKHWYGIQVDGQKLCSMKFGNLESVEIRFSFLPEAKFEMPSVTLNGVATGENSATTSPGKKYLEHEVFVSIPTTEFVCNRTNIVDISFPPTESSPRRAVVHSIKINSSAHNGPLARLSLPN